MEIASDYSLLALRPRPARTTRSGSFRRGTSTAMWLNQLSFFAPCQCFTFAGIMMTLPSVQADGILALFLIPALARGAEKLSAAEVAEWMCQLLRQAGSKVTFRRRGCLSGQSEDLRTNRR